MSQELSLLSSKELAEKIKSANSTVETIKRNIASLEAQMSNKLPDMTSAGIRDINQIIWPFIFSTGFVRTSSALKFAEKNITVTAEAGFVATKIIKTVFEKIGVGDYKLINTSDLTEDQIDNLKITISDPQSGRNFFKTPMPIQNIGNARFPTDFISRPMILPNSALNFGFYNDGAKEYYANITVIGYRIRVENAQELLSLVTY
jgi:hypothetical protein